jgi:hypothetical protein
MIIGLIGGVKLPDASIKENKAVDYHGTDCTRRRVVLPRDEDSPGRTVPTRVMLKAEAEDDGAPKEASQF